METIKNVMQLLVTPVNAKLTPAAPAKVDLVTDLADGELVVTTPQNVVLTGTPAPQPFKLIQRSGDVLIHSDIIYPKQVRHYTAQVPAEEVQQVTYWGHCPAAAVAAGALDTLANNIYTVRLYILDKSTAGFMQQKVKEGFYKSGNVVPTQEQVAYGLAASLIANYSRETEQDIIFAAVNSVPFAAGLVTLSVNQGSKVVTASAALTGPHIRIQEGPGLDNTDPVYKIVRTIDAVNFIYELNLEWSGESATGLATQEIDQATADGADWGVRAWGQDREFKAGYYPSNVAFWEPNLDFGPDAVAEVNDFAAFPGHGTYQILAHLEKELQADEFIYRGFVEAGVVDRKDVEDYLYDVVVLEHQHRLEGHAQGTVTDSPKSLMFVGGVAANEGDVPAANTQLTAVVGVISSLVDPVVLEGALTT